MSRPPLEDALPAAYPSPALEPERENILHVRLDETFADARAQAARRESKRAKGHRSPARFLIVATSICSMGYFSQGIVTTTLLLRNSYFNSSNETVHEITYEEKISSDRILSDTWRQNQNTSISRKNEYYLSTKNTTYKIDSGKYSEQVINPHDQDMTLQDKANGIISLSSFHKPFFSGVEYKNGKLLIHIKTALKENYWIDFRGRRTLDITNGVKNQLLLKEYRYDETPPPGIFDPERLKAMAKRAHSTAPTRPR